MKPYPKVGDHISDFPEYRGKTGEERVGGEFAGSSD